LHSTGADIREGQGEAFYVPSRDFISMPAFDAFKGELLKADKRAFFTACSKDL
jgi:antirestriction protein ArdC